jgi:hypothetical protein
MLLVSVLVVFAPSFSVASDEVYRCIDPSGVDLYTNIEQLGCEVMDLPDLTIAPNRGAAMPPNKTLMPYGLAPFPSDWFDYDGSVGSLRNQLTQGGLYGSQDWLDYDAPVGSMRNTPAYWPSPYGLYRW